MSRATVKTNTSKTNVAGSTREVILDVAEQHFAEAGYDGASLRDIQRAAKTNSGAVFYYFGTKQALFEAVFDRLAEPLASERLRRLALCRQQPGQPDILEQILSAHLTPALAGTFHTPENRWRLAQIRAQLVQAHHGFMADLLKRHYTKTSEKFLEALSEALPDLSQSDLQWRYHIMIGALTFTMVGPWKLQLGRLADQEDAYDPEDSEEALRQIINLSMAMFRAEKTNNKES